MITLIDLPDRMERFAGEVAGGGGPGTCGPALQRAVDAPLSEPGGGEPVQGLIVVLT
jgi:hypothetical protein